MTKVNWEKVFDSDAALAEHERTRTEKEEKDTRNFFLGLWWGFTVGLLFSVVWVFGARLTDSSMFGAALTPVQKVDQAQSEHFAKTGKYFSVVEYKTPTGEVGYQTIYREGGKVISSGTGPEAAERSFIVTEPGPMPL